MYCDEQALQKVREDRFLIDRYDGWLFDEMHPFLGNRILEVGCGLGNFTNNLVDSEVVVGIDVSAESIEQVRDRYSEHPHVHTFVADITDDACLELGRFCFDTVISINVLEHIEDDQRALVNTWRLLQPGGVLLLVVPAFEWLYGSMDRSIGHYRRYGKLELAAQLESVGFQIESQKYLNALAALGWLVNGRLLKQTTPPQGQLRLINPIIPLMQRLEAVVSPPIGLSLFTVARRMES
jgi:SAM-dependent methyltransferase